MPLRPERMWLDWDNALSLAGHDIEVKETYARCLRSGSRPELFLDIGANYGLHSLVFLAHDVETIAFEPNPACHQDFGVLCARNGLESQVEGVALGDSHDEVELVYPERETWLGTIRSVDARADSLRVQRVQQTTLDDYRERIDGRRVLGKIDTEGSECEILMGAGLTLDSVRPLLIFESLGTTRRRQLRDLLSEHGYGISSLPWDPDDPRDFLDDQIFLESPTENFIAVPR